MEQTETNTGNILGGRRASTALRGTLRLWETTGDYVRSRETMDDLGRPREKSMNDMK